MFPPAPTRSSQLSLLFLGAFSWNQSESCHDIHSRSVSFPLTRRQRVWCGSVGFAFLHWIKLKINSSLCPCPNTRFLLPKVRWPFPTSCSPPLPLISVPNTCTFTKCCHLVSEMLINGTFKQKAFHNLALYWKDSENTENIDGIQPFNDRLTINIILCPGLV